jgi:ribosome recycling factor
MVRQKAEEARVAVRNIRRDEVHRIDAQEKAGEVAQDAAKRTMETLQKITDAHIARIDQLATNKEAEVMEV